MSAWVRRSWQEPLLKEANLDRWHGKHHVLPGVAFEMRQGEVVTLPGAMSWGPGSALPSLVGGQKGEGIIAFEGQRVERR